MTKTIAQPGSKLKAIIKAEPKAPVKRKPMQPTPEYFKQPVIQFKPAHKDWRKSSVWMRGPEFENSFLTSLRLIHREVIGWLNWEAEKTFKKEYRSIQVMIYGSSGMTTDTNQKTIYQFYVWYPDGNRLWTAHGLMEAVKIVESIRLGEIYDLQKEKEDERKWREKRRKERIAKTKK